MAIADAIKRIRQHLFLDQNEFAKKLNISISSISLYERGERKPRLRIVKRIKELAEKNNVQMNLEEFLE